MIRIVFGFCILLFPLIAFSQQSQIERFFTDSSMIHSAVSICIINAETGTIVLQRDPERSLIQASVLKLITTAVALEKLGKDFTFKTVAGYSGKINKKRGKLKGDVIIKGGGDPVLGSENFPETYGGFIEKWVKDLKNLGIKKIEGNIVADDSYFDYQPVPAGWSWEDVGSYYGAGAYGLSVFDNTFQIHFKTSGTGSIPELIGINPEGIDLELTYYLSASGTEDNSYIYSAPYNNKGWISGTIPANREDFILNGSIPDPPLFLSKTIYKKLVDSGIKVSGSPVTTRLYPKQKTDNFISVSETISPSLSSIIEVLNHKSVNLYAEHLLKELGKVFKKSGTTEAGIQVVKEFLDSAGIKTSGLFMEDGSGLSSKDAVSSAELVKLLRYMKKNGKFFEDYCRSIPEAGKEGTLKSYFTDKIFDTRLKAKSGTMTRVKSYAGYVTTLSGKEMIFCIIVNNFDGPPRKIVSGIEEILKYTILNY